MKECLKMNELEISDDEIYDQLYWQRAILHLRKNGISFEYECPSAKWFKQKYTNSLIEQNPVSYAQLLYNCHGTRHTIIHTQNKHITEEKGIKLLIFLK